MNLREKFVQSGVKYTPQRQAVMEVILENPHRHLSSEEIHALLKGRQPETGLATVYRALILLEKLRFIRRADLGDGCTRYEACGGGMHAHHHLICTRCGTVTDMEVDLLEEIEKQVSLKSRFFIENHSLNFYGKCEKCRNEEEQAGTGTVS